MPPLTPLIPAWPLWAEACLVPALLAGTVFALGRVSKGGAIGGWVLAAVIYWCLGWRGLIIPLAFFLLADSATRFGYEKKAARGIAQEGGGRRGAKHAAANALAGMIAAILARSTGSDALAIAFCATFATAAADTVSSEIGQVLGKTPINPLTFKRVEPGTEGAVSMEGTVAGILGGAAVGGVAALVGYLPGAPLLVVGVITIAAALGNWLESAVGALGGARLNNELMNFFNTAMGGLIAWLILTLLPQNTS